MNFMHRHMMRSLGLIPEYRERDILPTPPKGISVNFWQQCEKQASEAQVGIDQKVRLGQRRIRILALGATGYKKKTILGGEA